MPNILTTEEIEKLVTVDLYKYLCITTETFSPEKVRKQYKKLAVKYHPDKNPNDKLAIKKFQMIELAYSVLSHLPSKDLYDRLFNNMQMEEEDFEDLKDIDRTKVGPKTVFTSPEQMADAVRKKNLELDPNYYNPENTGKLSDVEVANLIASRQEPTISEDLKEKFKKDAETLNSVEGETEEERQANFNKKFNEMFSAGISSSASSTAIQPYNKGKDVGFGYTIARIDQTETMFSDINEFEDQFAIHHHILDEEDGENMDFADYERQYLASLQEGSKMSEKVKASTLKNGRADYRFDEE